MIRFLFLFFAFLPAGFPPGLISSDQQIGLFAISVIFLIIYLIISKSSLSRPRLNLFLFCYLFYLIGIILGGLVSDSIIQSFLYATLLLVKFLLLEQVFVTKNYYLVSTALSLSVISPILISAFSSNRIIGVFRFFSSFQSNDFSTRLFLAGFNPNFIGITSSISFILLFDCFIEQRDYQDL